MEEKALIRLDSAAPLDDGGRKYNKIYVMSAIVVGIIGIITGDGVILSVLAGIAMGWFIKMLILAYKGRNLRNLKFDLDYPISTNKLVAQLVSVLTPLGMVVEVNVDGSPVVTYKGKIYDIILNEEQTFQIWWRKSMASAMFSLEGEISRYRKIVVAMGIIAYQVQQIAKQELNELDNEKQSIIEEINVKQDNDVLQKGIMKEPENLQYIFCSNCGEKLVSSDKFCKKCGNKLS